MPFLDDVLRPPRYGWQNEKGKVVKPTLKQLFGEYFYNINIFKSPKNWLAFFDFIVTVLTQFCFIIFIFKFLSWLTLIALILGVFVLSIHQTVWYHRYCTHQAYKFRNAFWRIITQNLALRVLSEESYTISHHVHHFKPDQPGDPYNAECGFFYCLLAIVNHQHIVQDLDEGAYNKIKRLMKHTGVPGNTYEQYLRWGTYTNPWKAMLSWLLNWSFWSLIFYLIGGISMLFCLWATTGVWLVLVRNFNHDGHSFGGNLQRDGIDFNSKDRSINQVAYGIVAGEWHNNHHLFPTSARSGFKPGQIDMAWYYIKFLSRIGAVSSYRDSKKQFYEKYYIPYMKSKASVSENAVSSI
ncbi:acyl-CoA desaturase [Mucilaginibacter puniceus]